MFYLLHHIDSPSLDLGLPRVAAVSDMRFDLLDLRSQPFSPKSCRSWWLHPGARSDVLTLLKRTCLTWKKKMFSFKIRRVKSTTHSPCQRSTTQYPSQGGNSILNCQGHGLWNSWFHVIGIVDEYRNHRIIKLLPLVLIHESRVKARANSIHAINLENNREYLWNLKAKRETTKQKKRKLWQTFQTPRLQGSALEDPLSEQISTRWTQQMKPLGAARLAELRRGDLWLKCFVSCARKDMAWWIKLATS